MRCFTALILFVLASPVFSQDEAVLIPENASFGVFSGTGEELSIDEIVEAMDRADVVFLGEEHDDPTAHSLELQLLRLAHERYGEHREVILSLEMFESDVQHVLNEYLAGYIRERDFLKASRPWSNYETDYRPLVEYAKENKLPVIAANAPGRYTSMARRRGLASLDSLSSFARYVLPHDRVDGSVASAVADPSEALSQKFAARMAELDGHGTMPGMPSAEEMLVAQNLRDATMAYWIANSIDSRRPIVIHVNGSFHSEGKLGIPEHLRRYFPQVSIIVVTMRSEEDYDLPPEPGADDFVIQTDKSLTPEDS